MGAFSGWVALGCPVHGRPRNPNRSPSSALEYSPDFNNATMWASCRGFSLGCLPRNRPLAFATFMPSRVRSRMRSASIIWTGRSPQVSSRRRMTGRPTGSPFGDRGVLRSVCPLPTGILARPQPTVEHQQRWAACRIGISRFPRREPPRRRPYRSAGRLAPPSPWAGLVIRAMGGAVGPCRTLFGTSVGRTGPQRRRRPRASTPR